MSRPSEVTSPQLSSNNFFKKPKRPGSGSQQISGMSFSSVAERTSGFLPSSPTPSGTVPGRRPNRRQTPQGLPERQQHGDAASPPVLPTKSSKSQRSPSPRREVGRENVESHVPSSSTHRKKLDCAVSSGSSAYDDGGTGQVAHFLQSRCRPPLPRLLTSFVKQEWPNISESGRMSTSARCWTPVLLGSGFHY
ncbi:hypothetical protein LshimejAT787_0206460 [Lyophyllum shimeji]|uniref:Uncharacterized protein n=1 Tax=Lyophyllum shimeji TaxID=47721 RepID=A0A9P3UL63_LYOSH|nr:hypothetical protein LshimejAT787_0206460 [Lyophyllum shimeji]